MVTSWCGNGRADPARPAPGCTICANNYASWAVMNGVPVPVASRLVGYSSTKMTLKFAHVGDREIVAAAERIGQAISQALDGPD